MARKTSTQLTPIELEIMKILWALGPSTVESVRQRMPAETGSAYTTVQTMLNLLEKKGKATNAFDRGRPKCPKDLHDL